MSLLGRLLSGAGGASSPKSTFDSHLEDQFTTNLLFPEPESLNHNEQVFPLSSGTILTPATFSNFDVNGELDLEARDVRVIILQEATGASSSAHLLYDSHPLPPLPPPQPPLSPSVDRPAPNNGTALAPRAEGGRRSISSPRKASVGQAAKPPMALPPQQDTPRGFGGAFDRRSHHSKTLSFNETEGQRAAREYREEMTTFSDCIFGNASILAYKGTGTKVHIIPQEPRTSYMSTSYLGEGSLGRYSMRSSSKLAQSFTSDAVNAPTSAGLAGPSSSTRGGGDRKKVLITRVFPVPLPNDDLDDAALSITPTPQNSHGCEVAGYPFPAVAGGDGASASASASANAHPSPARRPSQQQRQQQQQQQQQQQPRQKKTPQYAVGMIVSLPAAAPPHPPSAPVSRSSFRGPGSYTEQESFPSSFSSARRSGWTMLGHHGFGVESLESSFSTTEDDRIDTITQHWDIIMRTMSHLQAVATAQLLPLLRQADVSSPDPPSGPGHGRAASASVSVAGKRVQEDIKPYKIYKANIKHVQLTLHCLMQDRKIHTEVDAARQRIVTGIKARQVVTAQGRWGIWREEARLVGRWAGGKDEGFFFFNLLTGFLGNHTEWLQALGPKEYRQRHRQQQRDNRDAEISLPARTVIVSDNRIMARRILFLLAAFLPSNPQVAPGRVHRPSTSTSFGGYSQSPPNSHMPILRQESLRRKINKRSGASKAAHSRTMSFPTQPTQDAARDLAACSNPEKHHDRRVSDATSVKTANLPIPGSDIGTRKSSAATISTATPITTMPHFSTRRSIRVGTGPLPRPGSSGSLATDDLLRSLKRNESTGQYSNTSNDTQGQNSRWGSMISGFWSSKRRDSSASTTGDPLSMEGLEINDPRSQARSPPQKSKLVETVEEANPAPAKNLVTQQERDLRKSESGSASTAKPEDEQTEEIPEQIVQIANRPEVAYESPIKTSINDDGVIDIDIPLPSFFNYETAVSSPSSSGYLSNPGFAGAMEDFEHYSRAGPDIDTALNAGGWLPRYHPDFALQAIPSQSNLMEDIKASMRAEPTPVLTSTPQGEGGRTDRWVDISSAVIADTTNFTIKHIRYRRLIKLKPENQAVTSNPSSLDSRYGTNVYSAASLTPSIDIYESHIEERFIEVPIISMDGTLIEAVERIIAQSGDATATSSVCSSRSASRKGGSRDRSNSDAKLPDVSDNHLEVPKNECKKMVLSALEEIVREVEESRNQNGDNEAETERESFLREGVRSWLSNVDTVGAS